MADGHDKLCEEADVGSICDCSCAGRKHAIKHTKGGVPGAGAVSERARKLADSDGRAAVVNNRAVPKQGAPTAKGFKTPEAAAKPDAGKADAMAGTPTDQRVAAKTRAVFQGTSAEPIHPDHSNIAAGDWVTHVRKGVGVVEKAGKPGQPHQVKWTQADGSTSPVMSHELVKGEYPKQAAYNAAAEKAADSILKAGADPAAIRDAVNGMNPGEQAHTVQELQRRADAPGLPSRQANAKKAADLIRQMGGGNAATGKDAMTVTSRRRNGDAVAEQVAKPSEAGKSATAAQPTPGPAAKKVPAPLRDILAVVDEPAAHMDTAAAARYQKLTSAHMTDMTAEQKQAMLDDIRSRAKSYKPNSPTGQKLQRAFNTLAYASSQHKTGMKAGPQLQARGGDQVTHPEHGHGKVKSSVGGGDAKTAAATVDFGDKTVQVPQSDLTFGHVGADTNTTAKAHAGTARDTERAAKVTTAMTGLADKILGHRTDSYTPLKDRGGDITALNELSHYDPARFASLPAGDRAKVTAALTHMTEKGGAREVRQRAADTLAAFTGKPAGQVAPDPDPKHIADAKRALEGGGTTLPRSMVYAQVSAASLRASFTPEQRAKMHADATAILAKMSADARDRPGLEKVLRELDAIDGHSGTRATRTTGRDVMAVTSRRRNGDAVTEQIPKPTAKAGPRSDLPHDAMAGTPTDQRVAAKTRAVFQGTSAEPIHPDHSNIAAGDWVTHVRKGVGVVEKAGKPGQPHQVKWTQADGSSSPVMSHELVKGEYPKQAAYNAAAEKAADSILKAGADPAAIRDAVNGMNPGEQAHTVQELQRRADAPGLPSRKANAKKAADLIRQMKAWG